MIKFNMHRVSAFLKSLLSSGKEFYSLGGNDVFIVNQEHVEFYFY